MYRQRHAHSGGGDIGNWIGACAAVKRQQADQNRIDTLITASKWHIAQGSQKTPNTS
jgi:hypothetical protein